MSYRNVSQNYNTLNQLPMYSYGSGRFNTDNLDFLSGQYEQSQLPSDPTMFPQSLPMDPNMQHVLRMQGVDRGNIDYSLTDRITDGLGSFKNTVTDKLTGFRDSIGGGLKNILDNTIMGKIMAGFDATNPRAFNYNPALQGQIDFMKSQGMYGTNPTSGLNQIRGGVLAGKNLQSGFGSNDLGAMYEKSLAQTQKTIDNFENQWGNLKEEDEDAYNEKLQVHLNRKKQKEDEFAAFQAAQQKAADDRIAVEKQRAGTAPQRREGRGGDHMSRSVDQGGLGISAAQAQAVSDANRAAGMSGWGLADGGRVYLNLGGLARLL